MSMPDGAHWRDTFRWMLSRAHLVKVSEEDLGVLCPGVALGDFCTQALDQGVRLVLVTRGAQGALAATRSTRAEAAAVAGPVVDTVGAGDAFQAAMLAWLAENDFLHIDGLATIGEPRLRDALRFACTAASLTCARRGADLPTRAELAPTS